jgi:DNA-binding transcriptional ArsR family regulator
MMSGRTGDSGVTGRPCSFAGETLMARKKSPLLSVPEAARLFQLLGDASRLRLLRVLAERQEACVGDLCTAVRMPQSATSHHLMLLRRGQLVDYRRAGKQNFYRIRSPLVPELLRQISE